MKKLKLIAFGLTLAVVLAGVGAYFGLQYTKPVQASEETLKIIIPGGASGSYNTRFQLIKPEIEKMWGSNVEFIYGKNCTRAKKLIDAEKGPVLTIWQVEYNVNPDCNYPVKDQEIIAVETNGIRMCTSSTNGRTAADLFRPGAEYTIGHSDPHEEYRKWLDGFNKATGTNHKAVPFGSSGKARKGVLAGDVDFVFISPTNSNKLMAQGGKCFFSSLPDGEVKHKLSPLASVSPFKKAAINQGYFYAGFNMSAEKLAKLRKLYGEIASGKNSEFTKFTGTKDINMRGIEQMSIREMNNLMDRTLKLWTE